MNRKSVIFAMAVLCAGANAAAQSAPQSAAQNGAAASTQAVTAQSGARQAAAGQKATTSPAASPNTSSNGSANSTAQAGRPMSIVEAARLARAQRKAEPKAAMVLDDDNFPRGGGGTGAKATDLEVVRAQDASAVLADFRGKVVLLDFWATWCGACQEALPELKQMLEIYGGGDFIVVSVSEDDDENAWRGYVGNHGMYWPQRLDANQGLQQSFGVNALPTYVLIGRDGKAVRRYEGEILGRSVVDRVGPDVKKLLED